MQSGNIPNLFGGTINNYNNINGGAARRSSNESISHLKSKTLRYMGNTEEKHKYIKDVILSNPEIIIYITSKLDVNKRTIYTDLYHF